MNYSKEQKFEFYIQELRKLYEKSPNSTERATQQAVIDARSYIERKEYYENGKNTLLKDIDINKLSTCVLIIFIVLIGFLNIDNYPLYLFGVAFFLAGYYIGLKGAGVGLFFFFSHGMSGLCLMIGSLINPIIDNPLMEDNPTNIYIYFAIIVILAVVATLIVILYNLSNNLKSKKYLEFVPLIFYGIAFFLAGLLPRIIDYIYNIHIF